MKIRHLQIGTVDTPLIRPFTTALRSITAITSIIVRLETDTGLAWGAAAPSPAVTGDTAKGIIEDLRATAAWLPGVTFDDPHEVLGNVSTTTHSGKAAIDIALHDAWAQAQGQPLHQLLGGARPEIVTDITISIDTPEAMAAETRDALARGFSILKVKLGADAAGDHARLVAVRREAPEATIRVDANQGWTADEAIRLVTGFEEARLDVELVEQPVPRGDLDGLAAVTHAVATPVLADEAIFDLADARRVLNLGAATYWNLKLMKSGGIAGAMPILDLARQAGVDCMIGAMMEGRVGISAAAALACGQPAVTMADLDPPLLTMGEPVTGGLAYEGELARPADAPGLGITDVVGVQWIN